ncbi:MAG: ExbD/TolR family protein, partial [Bryobacteraceae bacterium]
MIDVLLVLIIIFMVITPVNSVGLPAGIPQSAESGNPAPSLDIVVAVEKDRSLSINQQPIRPEELEQRLRQIFAARARQVLFVRGHRDLDFENIAHVIDRARSAGVIQIGL